MSGANYNSNFSFSCCIMGVFSNSPWQYQILNNKKSLSNFLGGLTEWSLTSFIFDTPELWQDKIFYTRRRVHYSSDLKNRHNENHVNRSWFWMVADISVYLNFTGLMICDVCSRLTNTKYIILTSRLTTNQDREDNSREWQKLLQSASASAWLRCTHTHRERETHEERVMLWYIIRSLTLLTSSQWKMQTAKCTAKESRLKKKKREKERKGERERERMTERKEEQSIHNNNVCRQLLSGAAPVRAMGEVFLWGGAKGVLNILWHHL